MRDGPAHVYIGASPACWDTFARMTAGEPEIAPTQWSPLVTDAYCAQHRGPDTPQARQSVAVHALTLWAVLVDGARPSRAVTLRVRAVDVGRRTGGWERLDPWPEWPMTIHDVVDVDGPAARAEGVEEYVRSVWETLHAAHTDQIDEWIERLGS